MTPEKRLAEARKQLKIVEDELEAPEDYMAWADVSNARIATESARERLEGDA